MGMPACVGEATNVTLSVVAVVGVYDGYQNDVAEVEFIADV